MKPRPPAWTPAATRRGVGALVLLLAALTVLYGINYRAVHALPGADGPGFFWYYPAFFALVFALYVGAVRLAWQGGPRIALAAIGLGLLFRLAMLPTAVVLSSDPYRYLWDGRVQLAGINPYLHPPESAALAGLRDPEIHPRVNRPWAPTIYPPGAQMLFAALAWLAPNRLWALRLMMVFFELLTMILLAVLLRRLGLPEGRVAVYAWAPLAVFELAQAGHIDAAVLPLVLGALLGRIGCRPALAGALLGGAALVKLYPAALLPALWQRRSLRLPVAFAATVMAGYLPYAWGTGVKVLGFLPTYFAPFEDFNVGLRALLTEGIGLRGGGARLAVMAPLVAALASALMVMARRRAETPAGIAAACGAAIGTYLLLIPSSIHPWYVVWLVPFLAIAPSPAWWYLSGAVALSYVAYTVDPPQVPVWARVLEYAPAYVLVLLGLRGQGRERGWQGALAVRSKPAS